jgi:hypothetical protein
MRDSSAFKRSLEKMKRVGGTHDKLMLISGSAKVD